MRAASAHLFPLHSLDSIGRRDKLPLEKGHHHERQPGLAVPLPGQRHACAMVVRKELLHLVQGDLDAGLRIAYPRLRLHVVLRRRLLLHLVVALEVDGEGVRHPAGELGGPSLYDKGVRRFFEKDGEGQMDEIAAGWQHVGEELAGEVHRCAAVKDGGGGGAG